MIRLQLKRIVPSRVAMSSSNVVLADANPLSTGAAGCWSFAAADAQLPLQQPVVALLGDLGVIRVDGEDAVRFLHGQLTSDLEQLRRDRVESGGYCTAKGRLLATFRIWRSDDAVFLLLPREILPGVLKRLSMFVLRAKAKLVDASNDWRVAALFGSGAAESLRQRGLGVPATAGDSIDDGMLRIARLQSGRRITERFLLLGHVDTDLASLAGLATVGSGGFWGSETDAGVPTVFAATQERFVPQMINYEVIGGVSFSKGCYPGQEVVARSQYRGKLRRRMHLAHGAVAANAGADVFAEGEAEAIGTVVMSATSPGGGFDLLLECPQDKAEGPLHLGDGARLALQPLPYSIVDVTA